MSTLNLEEPVVRLESLGLAAMSDADLFSILIGGTDSLSKARNLLSSLNYDLRQLSSVSGQELQAMGLTQLQSYRFLCSVEILKRRDRQPVEEKPQLRSSSDTAKALRPYLSDLPHEEFYTIFLNRANRIISIEKISQGGWAGTVTDVRMILKRALLLKAQNLIISHNHPSGNTQPSEADIKITDKLKGSGAVMDIQLLDHIIIADGYDYYSFADNGMI